MQPATTITRKVHFGGEIQGVDFIHGIQRILSDMGTIIFKHFPKIFNHLIGSRTIFNILFVHVHIIHHSFFCVVGETGAVARSHLVYATLVRFRIQKLAGLLFIEPVSAFVPVQPFLAKSLFSHAQILGNSLNISAGIGRRHGLATVRAVEAVDTFPYLLVSPSYPFVKASGSFLFQPGQIALNPTLVSPDHESERTQIYSYHTG